MPRGRVWPPWAVRLEPERHNVKVLYITIPELTHPWFDDFKAAVGDRAEVILFEPDQPHAAQFAGVGVVVELGGGQATHAFVDLALAAGVQLWQISGTGLNHVDVAYFLERGLPLANTPGQYSSVALAEHAIFLMLACAKYLHLADRNIRSRVLCLPLTEELEGQTLGLVGLGASGRELARRAWPLGMRILAIDAVPPTPQIVEELHVEFLGGPDRLDDLLAASDVVSLHVPLMATTHHLIDARALARMKPTATLINVARGEIVDETALLEALRSRRIRAAGLDVFAREPIDPEHPFLHLDNVIATPHIAGGTTGTSRRRGQALAENIARVTQGLPPLRLITDVP
jgi:D-3-phosphoglycerate dehydrogenase